MRSLRLCPVPPCPINTSGLRPDAAVGCHNTPGMACQPRSTVNPRSRTPEAVVVSSVHCGCLMPVSLVNVRLLLLDLKPRMVKKSISIDFQKNKNVFIAAALIVGRYYPKYLRNLHRRLHPGHAETTGTQ